MIFVSILILGLAMILYWYYRQLSAGKATSVIVQAMHFMARPHVELPSSYKFQEILLPNAWNGTYMSQHPDLWTTILSEQDQLEFSSAILHFESLNKSLEALQIEKGDFPLSWNLMYKIKSWKYQLSPKGYGFYRIRKVPVHLWSLRQSEIFFFALGKFLGTPGAQDLNGTLLGHVKSLGYKDNNERPYRQTVDIAYHCDGADVVGLLCIHPSKEGGISRIISSTAVFNRLLQRNTGQKGQEYARILTNEIFSAIRPTFGLGMKLLPFIPLKIDVDGVLRTFWNQEYYLKAYRHPNGSITNVGEKYPVALEAIEAYDHLLQEDMQRGYINRGNCSDADTDPTNDCLVFDRTIYGDELGLDMILEEGDVQLVSNHFILHARTEFTDFTDEEIDNAPKRKTLSGEFTPSLGKRELYRLWLSQSTEDLSWRQYLSKQVDLLRVFSFLFRGLFFYR